MHPDLRAALRALFRGVPAEPQWFARFDAGEWAATLRANGIHGIVHEALRRQSGAGWPAEMMEGVRSDVIAEAGREELRGTELRALVTAFEDAGAPLLILKGSALAYSLYPEPHLRPRADVDVYVEHDHFEAARSILSTLGYSETSSGAGDAISHQSLFERRAPNRFIHRVDVHWQLSNSPVVERLAKGLLGGSEAIPAIGPGARGLPPIESLLFASVHRIAHHHGSDRLIWLYDIHLLAESLDDDSLRRLFETAARLGVLSMCRESIQTAHGWFGGRDALAFAPAELPSEYSARLLKPRRSRANQLWTDLGALAGWRGRVRYLRDLFFPPVQFMRQRYGVESAIALPFYYVFRSVRAALRAFAPLSDL